MLKRMLRYPLPKILLCIELVITLVVMSNLSEVMERFFRTEVNRILGNGYKYNKAVEVYIQPPVIIGSEVPEEYTNEEIWRYNLAREQLEMFLKECSTMKGNISVYPIGANISNGPEAGITVFFSTNEKLMTSTETGIIGEWKDDGVYIGNAYFTMVENNTIGIGSDTMDVLDILTNSGFEKNKHIYVKYSDLSNLTKQEVIDSIMYYAYEDEIPFVVFYQSNLVSEKEFLEKMEQLIKKYDLITFSSDISQNTESYTLSIDTRANTYRIIKYVFMIMAICMCSCILFQACMLILRHEKNDIFIMRTYGLSGIKIWHGLLMQILCIFIFSITISLVVELAIYYAILNCDLFSILKNMGISILAIIILILIIFTLAFRSYSKKNMAEVLTVEEV